MKDYTLSNKHFIKMLISRLCAFLMCYTGAFAVQWTWAWEGKVTAVPECGSLRVESDTGIETVELYGIECPEEDQPYFHDAITIATYLAKGKYVEISPMYESPEGIPKALVRLIGSGKLLSQQLISYGMAWVSINHCLGRMCKEWKKVQSLAKKNRIGLWADRSPVPPWEWRKRRMMEILRHGKIN